MSNHRILVKLIGANETKKWKKAKRKTRLQPNLELLPVPILHKIFFDFCDSVSLLNLCLASKKFNAIIKPMIQQEDQKEESNKSELNLNDLPSEILVKIFVLLDIPNIGRLSQVSRRLREIGQADCIWLPASRHVIITNSIDGEFRKRTKKTLLAKEKVRISHNWKKGIYAETNLLVQDKRYMPRIQLDKETLWVSWGTRIWAHQRSRDGTIQRKATRVLKGHIDDVSRFVVKDGTLISAGRDCAMVGWNSDTGEFLFAKRYCHREEVTAVDYVPNHQIVISGSRDQRVRVWNMNSVNKLQENKNMDYLNKESEITNSLYPTPIKAIDVGDRIWSLAASPDGSRAVLGTGGLGGVPAIRMINLNYISGHMFPMGEDILKKGAGTLDIAWHGEFCFLTCGYDAATRFWDTRVGKCTRVWEEPFNESVYSIATDNHMSLVCGMARHGLVRLWDLRHKQSVQMYYTKHPRKGQSSPVYSVGFDSSNLYVAMDQSLNLLTFAGLNNIQNKRKFRRF